MKTDRGILASNDQNSGQIADPNKLEDSIKHVADVVDENDNGFNSHKDAAELAHPDKSVTEKKLADKSVSKRAIQAGAVGATELDPAILSQPTSEFGVQAKFQEIDERADNIKALFFNQNKKRIALQLPICPPQYNTIIANNGYSYIYPQSFTIDELANEILIAYSSSGGSNNNQWVSIYDWTTGVHKTIFSAGNGIGEGIRVIYSGGKRLLYLKGETSGYLSRYDITNLPASLARLTAESTYNVDHYAQFTEKNGLFYIESNTAPTGVSNRRNVFTRFSSDLITRLGEVSFNIFDSGDLNNYETYLMKRQGLAVGNGFFVGGYGALYVSASDQVTTERYMGTKIFNNLGECVATNLYSPDLMIDILSQNDVPCTRIENEGVCISSDNKVYSLFVTQDATNSSSSSTGIVIFEEFSNQQNAIDFTNAMAPTVSFPKHIAVYYPPRTQGAAIYNPVTGAKFNTLNEIMDFMAAVDCREFQFYTTSASGITDLSGTALPGSCHVLIHNMNNSTFFYEVRNQAKSDYYLANGSPRVATRATFSEVGLSTSLTPANNSGMTIQLTSNTQLTFKVKGSDGVVRSANLTLA